MVPGIVPPCAKAGGVLRRGGGAGEKAGFDGGVESPSEDLALLPDGAEEPGHFGGSNLIVIEKCCEEMPFRCQKLSDRPGKRW